MLIAALLKIAKMYKEIKYLSMDESIINMAYYMQ